MTTKTDNYRELAREIRLFDSQMTGGCSCGPHTFTEIADAIDALIKEREVLKSDYDEAFAEADLRDTLARENESLREALAATEEANQRLQNERRKVAVRIEHSQECNYARAERAALANAPTPNDKGK